MPKEDSKKNVSKKALLLEISMSLTLNKTNISHCEPTALHLRTLNFSNSQNSLLTVTQSLKKKKVSSYAHYLQAYERRNIRNLCNTPDRNQSGAEELMDQYPNAAS